MSHSHTDQEAHNAEAMAEIKKVTIILSVFTIVELILGFWMISLTSEALILAIKGTIVILMMAKAFYIVAYFMHLCEDCENVYILLELCHNQSLNELLKRVENNTEVLVNETQKLILYAEGNRNVDLDTIKNLTNLRLEGKNLRNWTCN